MQSDRTGAPGLAPSTCAPWGFWASLAWTFAALVAWAAAQFVFTIAFLSLSGHVAGTDESPPALLLLSVAFLSAPAPVIVLFLAARRARCGIADYFALATPPLRDLTIGLACLAVLLPTGDVMSYLSGRDVVPPFVIEAYRQARDANALLLLIAVFVIAAPAMEELIFRGFLLRGFAASSVGPAGAIGLASVGWAVMHVQYELFYVLQIVIIGLVFGWLRWRSGSTILTIILHAVINATALAQTMYIVEWMD
jgi:membrane protease YdiL (CAAX protease family)